MALSAFFAAWFIHLLAAASPGPSILMAARIGVTAGMQTGVFLALGLGLGALFWAISAVFGLALLFEYAPGLLWALKIAGGCFLMWIAYRMWRHAPEPLAESTQAKHALTPLKALRLGVATQLSNPKPAVFFGAVFVGTVPQDATALALTALLALIFLNEFVCNLAVARMFSFQRIRLGYQTAKTLVDRCFGGILAALGAKIALT